MPLSRREFLAALPTLALAPDPFAFPLERRRAGRWEPGTVPAGTRLLALYFGAGWCGPCRAFVPRLIAAYPRLRRAGVEVAFVGDDASEAAQRDYMLTLRMPWPAVPWPHPARRRLRAKGGAALPGLLVLDPTGATVLNSWRDGHSYPAATLDRLLHSSSISKS